MRLHRLRLLEVLPAGSSFRFLLNFARCRWNVSQRFIRCGFGPFALAFAQPRSCDDALDSSAIGKRLFSVSRTPLGYRNFFRSLSYIVPQELPDFRQAPASPGEL